MFILVNIGCIECGVSSDIVGVFTRQDVAVSLAKQLNKTHSWRESGQNSFEVFPMPAANVINPEYLED